LSPGAGQKEAWTQFQRRCIRLPGWQAAMARGLGFSALFATASHALALPLVVGWIALAVCMMVTWSWFAGSLGQTRRLADYLRECLEAKYGRRLFEYAQLAAGTPKREGIYGALIRLLREVEIPTVERFDEERSSIIKEAREEVDFPPLEGTSEYMLEPAAGGVLHGIVRAQGDESTLADDARVLLQDENLYDCWRYPAIDRVLEKASLYSRRRRLPARTPRTSSSASSRRVPRRARPNRRSGRCAVPSS